MTHMRRAARSAIPLLGLAVVALALPQSATADGWKIQLQGGKSLATSYAGRSALFEDASVVWFNPAGMTALDGEWVITFGAPLITYQLDFRDAGSRSLIGQPLSGDATPDGGTTAVVPHAYLVRRLDARWRVGFGFNAPFGLGTNYGETWIGRYHATETTLRVFNLNPSVAVKLSDRWSAGLGLDVQRSTATLANMIDFGSIGAAVGLPLTPQGSDGKVEFTGSDWAAGFDVSAWGDLAEDVRLGAVYRSQIDHGLRGTADFEVPHEAAPLTGGGLLFEDSAARVVLPMPHELSVSAMYEVDPDWRLLADLNWTRWSAFKELLLTFENPAQPPVRQAANWNDSVRVALGATRKAGPRWTLRGGLAYETAPVPDATRGPRLPEDDHAWLSAGATYTGDGHWTVDAHYSHLITPDGVINLQDPTAGGLAGAVHWRLNVFGVSGTWRF
jgi:long-chain fatty acid transport protein